MRTLTEAAASGKTHRYAYCQNCKETFVDDVLAYGALFCPNWCGFVVMRGVDANIAEKMRSVAIP